MTVLERMRALADELEADERAAHRQYTAASQERLRLIADLRRQVATIVARAAAAQGTVYPRF